MDLDVDSNEIVNLQCEMYKIFPHFGQLKFYMQIFCDSELHHSHEFLSDEWMIESDIYSMNTCENCKYRCRLNFLGMFIQSLGYFKNFQAAKINVSSIANSILNEMNRLIISKSLDDSYDELLAPIVSELKIQVPMDSPPNNIDQFDDSNPIPIISHIQKLSIKDKINDLISTISQKISSANSHPERLNVSSSNHDMIQNVMEFQDKVNPVSVLYQHYQKRSAMDLLPPKFDHFERRGYYGCILEYCGKKFVVEAIYRIKNDSKYEAAKLACIDLFDKQFLFTKSSSVSDEIFSRENSKEAVICTSSELSTLEFKKIHDVIPAKVSSSFSLDGIKSCVTCLNEFCQLNKLPLPDFQFQTGLTISSFYICYLKYFLPDEEMDKDGIQFASSAFVKKNEAKEDCAKRVIQKLLRDGMVTNDGKPIKSIELDPHFSNHPPAKYVKYDNDMSKFESRSPFSNAQFISSYIPLNPHLNQVSSNNEKDYKKQQKNGNFSDNLKRLNDDNQVFGFYL